MATFDLILYKRRQVLDYPVRHGRDWGFIQAESEGLFRPFYRAGSWDDTMKVIPGDEVVFVPIRSRIGCFEVLKSAEVEALHPKFWTAFYMGVFENA